MLKENTMKTPGGCSKVRANPTWHKGLPGKAKLRICAPKRPSKNDLSQNKRHKYTEVIQASNEISTDKWRMQAESLVRIWPNLTVFVQHICQDLVEFASSILIGFITSFHSFNKSSNGTCTKRQKIKVDPSCINPWIACAWPRGRMILCIFSLPPLLREEQIPCVLQVSQTHFSCDTVRACWIPKLSFDILAIFGPGPTAAARPSLQRHWRSLWGRTP